jgi:hypothetical protein
LWILGIWESRLNAPPCACLQVGREGELHLLNFFLSSERSIRPWDSNCVSSTSAWAKKIPLANAFPLSRRVGRIHKLSCLTLYFVCLIGNLLNDWTLNWVFELLHEAQKIAGGLFVSLVFANRQHSASRQNP